jgi:hypothetical protein
MAGYQGSRPVHSKSCLRPRFEKSGPSPFLTPVLRAKHGPVSRRLGSKDRAAPGHGKRGCGPRHKLRLWRLVPTRRRYRSGVDRGIGIIPAQKTATLHFGTMCFGTIGAGWVSEFGWPGWVVPASRYIQSPQPTRPRSLPLRPGPSLLDTMPVLNPPDDKWLGSQ